MRWVLRCLTFGRMTSKWALAFWKAPRKVIWALTKDGKSWSCWFTLPAFCMWLFFRRRDKCRNNLRGQVQRRLQEPWAWWNTWCVSQVHNVPGTKPCVWLQKGSCELPCPPHSPTEMLASLSWKIKFWREKYCCKISTHHLKSRFFLDVLNGIKRKKEMQERKNQPEKIKLVFFRRYEAGKHRKNYSIN